jgi:hypothetical protein
VPFNCPYPFCRWDEVQTLGVCGTCEDVTADTKEDCPSSSTLGSTPLACTYIFPNLPEDGQKLVVKLAPDPVLLGSAPTSSSKPHFGTTGFSNPALGNVGTLGNVNYDYIAGFGAVNTNGGQMVATRCEWRWCVQTQKDIFFNATTNKPPSAASISSTPLRRYVKEEMSGNPTANLSRVHYTSQPANADPATIKPENIFAMDPEGEANLAIQLSKFFTTSISAISYVQTQPSTQANQQLFSDGTAAFLQQADLKQITESMATSLTNAIRGKENLIISSVQGSGWKEEPYFHLRPLWLLWSGLIVLMSCLLLVITLLRNKTRRDIFKSSTLAILFHGFEGNQGKLKVPRPERPEQLVKAADNINVKWRENDEGNWKLCEVV